MLSIYIVCIGKLRERYLKEACDEYAKRLSKYCKLHIVELPDEKIPDKASSATIADIKEKECNNIISHLPKDSYLICLDLKGKQLSSEEFANTIDTLSLIGGSLGITTRLLGKCQQSLCFSKMTFPHPLIRVFLLEQLFRGFKISHGETYHK